jgi:cell division septum initiation protein DivIVA
MSVSITSGNNADLSAIISGGDEFLKRVKTYQEAKKKAEEAQEKLNLGKDVVKAMADAQAKEQAATDALREAKEQAAKIIEEANKAASDKLHQAQETAKQVITNAQTRASQIDKDAIEAKAMVDEFTKQATADAEEVKKQSAAAKAQITKMHSEVKKAHESALHDQEQAKKALQAVETLEATLNAIKLAASQ